MPEGGQMNLDILVAITKAQADLASIAQSVRSVDTATKQVGKSGQAMQEQFEKAGKTLAGIGKGGVIMAGVAAIRWVIQQTKEWEEGLLAVAKAQGKTAEGAKGLVQAMPRKLSAAEAATLTSGALKQGADLGLNEESTAKALGPVMGKIKGKGFAEAQQIISTQLGLVASGVSPEEAAKRARGAGRAGALETAAERETALMQREPGLYGAERNRRLKSLASYEATHPTTDLGRAVMDEGFGEERRRTIDEVTARRAGYIPKEGEGFSAWQQVKQDIGGGRLFDPNHQEGWDAKRAEVDADFGRAVRGLGNIANEGSR